MAFGGAGRGDVFLVYFLLQESGKPKEQVDDLTIEQNKYLEEIQRASNLFLAFEVVLESFEYLGPLVIKV